MTKLDDASAADRSGTATGRLVRMAHVITGLDVGGAEMALLRLLRALDPREMPSFVVSLKPGGAMALRLRDCGIEVLHHPMSAAGIHAALGSLAARLVERRVDVVQTWMHHADLFGGLAARRAGVRGVAWGIRASTLDPVDVRLSTRAVVRTCAMLSRRVPDRIVANSFEGARRHVALGYNAGRMLVIPNGFVVGDMPQKAAARAEVGRELGLASQARLVGAFGRFDAQKDFDTFCHAAGLLARSRPDAHFVLAGRGLDATNLQLARWLRDAGIESRVSCLGLRDDVPRLAAAMDIVTLASSWGEAFPQVVGEAMACGTPCVVTDVGDSAAVVADTGLVVRPGDAAALAAAWARLLDLPRSELASLGERARARVAREYAMESVAASYARLYRDLAGGSLRPTSAGASPNFLA